MNSDIAFLYQYLNPRLLSGLEACSLVKSELASLDFVVDRFFMKMFGQHRRQCRGQGGQDKF